jgi:GAF domain-containing protein
MTEKKGRSGRRSDRPPSEMGSELKAQRDQFVHTFFKRGAEFTEELVKENDRLRKQMIAVEAENTRLRTQLASDTAIRDLLKKIEQLETEKEDLRSSVHEAEEVTSRFTNRFQEIESELENFANLYVASYQLHSSLRLPLVLRHLKELLMQLVGARSVAFYVASSSRTELLPVATGGIDGGVSVVPLVESTNDGAPGAVTIERVFLTGVPFIIEGDLHASGAPRPVACVPMRVEDEVVGVIVVLEPLEQKRRFLPVDYELFKLLGAHAGTALVSAELYARAGNKLPSLDEIRDLER